MVVSIIFVSSSNGDLYAPVWKALWRAKAPNKVAIFGWSAVHNLLPTRVTLLIKVSCFVFAQLRRKLPSVFPMIVTLLEREWLLEKVVSLSEYF